MRAFSVVILTLLCTFYSHAQQKSIKETIKTQAGEEVNFDFKRANVKFTTWDKNEISITGTAMVNMGENNDAFTINAKQIDGEWHIRTFLKEERKLPKMIVMSKDGVETYRKAEKNKNLWENDIDSGDYDYINYGVMAEISLEIKIPQSIDIKAKSKFGDIDIENFEGKLEVKNTHGYVNAVFSKSPRKDITLSSTHNFVDVSVPKNARLDVEMRTSHGEILTDLDLDISQGSGGKNRNSCSNKNRVAANFNGGGNDLRLKSTHNKIYLREYKMNN